MTRQIQPQITSLKDLYISSYLKAKSFPLHDADLDHQGRTVFHFVETPELKRALMDYYANNAIVSPSAFIEAFKSLRSLAYSLSDKKNMEKTKYGNTRP
ncbi:MAG: DUF5659 domain-containing protein [Candidatus Methylomirabilis sp.]|nr:DUF5659 domain-containing protein [Deltaproteobacteria bacterium]